MARPDLSARVQHAPAAPHARRRDIVGRRDGVRVEVDGRWQTDFRSDDHLGLSQHFSVVNALQDTAARDGAGAAASPLLQGRHALHDTLERELADWLGCPRALLFNSGFLANLAVQQALLGEDGDVCVQDTLNHASLVDATCLAGARLRRYPHLDSEGAMRQLRAHAEGAAMLVTEGVFGLDGDSAPLRALSLVARMQQALLYVDDTHGVGVVGPNGRGSVAAAGLGTGDVGLQLVDLGPALGGSGALVAGDAALVDHLAGHARAYLHSAMLPPAQAAAALESLRLARRDQWRREKLDELVGLFRGSARRHGLSLAASETPVQPLLCGSHEEALAMAQALQQSGWRVGAITAPTVAEGRARLRVSLSALHTVEQVQAVVDAIAQARDRMRPALAAPLGA